MKTSNEKIFVIDDDESVRRSLPMLLESMEFEVETFPSSEDFLNREPFEGTGCILLDINLGGKSGLELQDDLIDKKYGLPIIFITGKGGVPESVRAFRKGAINFLQKPVDGQRLLDAVEEAVSRSREINRKYSELSDAQKTLSNLTEREFEIFRYVISGMPSKQIAQELNIAEQTVKLHRSNIVKKLGVKSVAQMVQIAEKAGINLSSD